MPTVLMIEDEPSNHEVVARLLTRQGYTVLFAQTGAQGLALAHEHLPDLVVTDIGLPDMSGHTLIYRLKHAPETGHIPVMALTAYALQEDRQAAADAGCDAFEAKPIDLGRWLGTIQTLLGREA